MNVTLFRLAPRGPVQFGSSDPAAGGVVLGSDALMSAICVSIRDLFGPMRLAGFLRAGTAGAPPVRVSSLVPTVDGIVLLPAPFAAGPGKDDARWVSPARFAAIGQGETPADPLLLQDGLVAIDPADGTPAARRLWRHGVPSHPSGGGVVFAPGCGLALLALIDDDWRPDVTAAVLALGDSGLGGDRAIGYGQFDVSSEPFDIPDAPNPAVYCTIARYLPTASELADGVLAGAARYRLVDSGGWIGSIEGAGQTRKRVRMVAEGSLVGPLRNGGRPSGQVADVTPDGFSAHRVYRAGWALAVGMAA